MHCLKRALLTWSVEATRKPFRFGVNFTIQSRFTEQCVKQKVEHATLWLRTQPNPTFSGVHRRLPLAIEGVSILGVS